MPPFRIAQQEFDPEIDLASIRPHPRNVNQGDIGAIYESMQSHGFFGAIVVQRSTGYILVGNHRYLTAREAGLASLPGFWLDCDDDEALRILLVDNRTARLWADDEPALLALLRSLAESPAGLTGTAYSFEDMHDIAQALAPPDLGSLAGGHDPSGSDLWPELKFRVPPPIRQAFYDRTEDASDRTDSGRFVHLMDMEGEL